MARPTASIAPSGRSRRPKPGSHVEKEVHDVAVLDDVLLPFHTQDAFGAGSRFRAVREELVPADHLRLDETALEVGVDDAGRLRGLGSLADDPGAAFVFAGREIALQAEQVESRADELVEARLGESDVCEKILPLVGGKILD